MGRTNGVEGGRGARLRLIVVIVEGKCDLRLKCLEKVPTRRVSIYPVSDILDTVLSYCDEDSSAIRSSVRN